MQIPWFYTFTCVTQVAVENICSYSSFFFCHLSSFPWLKAIKQMIIKPSGGQTKKNIHLLPCLSGISCPATSSSCECLERKRASNNILSPAFSCCALMSLARRYVKRRAFLRSHVDSRDDGNVCTCFTSKFWVHTILNSLHSIKKRKTVLLPLR